MAFNKTKETNSAEGRWRPNYGGDFYYVIQKGPSVDT